MMRRNAVVVVTSLFALSLLPGCAWWKNRKAKQSAEAATDYNAGTDPYYAYNPNAAAPASANTYSAGSAYASTTVASASYSGGGGRSHTVQKGDTIFKLAREYYGGDASKWRTIYDANRDQLSDPNKIRVGQRLVIP